MTQEHTPGEWHYTKYGDATVTIDSILKISSEEDDSGGFKNIRQRTICELNEPLGLEEEDYANARLIAAAPLLLDALEDLVQHLEDYSAYVQSYMVETHIEKAKAAIVKAKAGAHV